MKYKLSEVAYYSKEKIKTDELSPENYLSTENMLPEFGGITTASSLPTISTVTKYQPGDILLSNIRPYFKKLYYSISEGGCSNDVLCLCAKDNINKAFLYYSLKNDDFFKYVMATAKGTKMPRGDKSAIMDYELEVPDLETQKKIVRILSALDQKIELNNQQSKNLFELGRQLYIEKFENNETIDKVELEDFFPVVTGKKDANASSENGKYPFFTCSKTISKIDDYVFDNSAILLAGNGDFNVKFYRGKFDAYQRTYVLIPNNPDYLGFLYWAISYNLPRITANYRGSVIKFITKGNIESFKVPFVDNEYIPAFMKYLERIEKNNQQNKVLAGLRDALLPKLMSGEINLNEATINE